MSNATEVKFNIEANVYAGFYTIYTALMDVYRRYSKYNTETTFSIVGAEAYWMLQDLKLQDPEMYKQCEEEYNGVRGYNHSLK